MGTVKGSESRNDATKLNCLRALTDGRCAFPHCMCPPKNDALSEAVAAAAARHEALSPVDKALAESDQRRSYVEGETGRDPGDVLADEVRRLRGCSNRRAGDSDDAARFRWWLGKWTAESDEAIDELNDALKGACTPEEVRVCIDVAIKTQSGDNERERAQLRARTGGVGTDVHDGELAGRSVRGNPATGDAVPVVHGAGCALSPQNDKNYYFRSTDEGERVTRFAGRLMHGDGSFVSLIGDVLAERIVNLLNGSVPSAEGQNERDKDWVLAMSAALGSDSGYSIPIVPKPEPFKELFAALRSASGETDAARYRFWREFYNTRFAITIGEKPYSLKFAPSRPAVEPAGENYRALVDAALDEAMRTTERTTPGAGA